ncbi:hypothetical protein OUZ56_018716 [Daphnia magna]|uniref:Uncharacterized protein n=1 Tax=Daphnia magna TaxID=35525 RepID=A0ABQ9Z9L8_9CRUS|nr:hypothetical protein OUZ56_018716 [Daphnia magna]
MFYCSISWKAIVYHYTYVYTADSRPKESKFELDTCESYFLGVGATKSNKSSEGSERVMPDDITTNFHIRNYSASCSFSRKR